MGIEDDAKNKAEEMKGRGKEAAGSLTDNEDLKQEGKSDQGIAQGKQKVADAADAVKGKVDDVKNKLKDCFAKDEIPTDSETNEMLGAIKDLEGADEETAIRMAGETARKISETPVKKKNVVEE